MKVVGAVLGKRPKAAVLLGTKGAETGIAISLVESKSKKKVLDGWTVDVFGGTRLKSKQATVGLGVTKKIFDNEVISLGAGLFVTKPLRNFLDMNSFKSGKDLNFAVGITGRF